MRREGGVAVAKQNQSRNKYEKKKKKKKGEGVKSGVKDGGGVEGVEGNKTLKFKQWKARFLLEANPRGQKC